jgi:hypothetical protein
MQQRHWIGKVCAMIAVLGLIPALAVASPILGTFNIAGTITVGQSGATQTISWLSDTGVANKATIGTTGLSGSFAGLGGTTVTIRSLTNPPQVVDGAGFADTLFITFDAAPGLGSMFLNYIYPGVNGSAACGAPAAPGQTCALAGSPFDFQNTSDGGSRAGWVFLGDTPENVWKGNFTSQFNVPYQTVFANLASSGSVTNTYSATFTVSAVPEPGTVLMSLGGAALLLIFRKRRA